MPEDKTAFDRGARRTSPLRGRGPVRALAVAALATLVVLLGACSSPSGAAGPSSAPSGGQKLAPSLVALFQQTLDRDSAKLSGFERDVLTRAVASGKISALDYEEAFNRRSSCMTDAGYRDHATKMPNGLYQLSPQPPAGKDPQKWMEAWADADKRCATGNLIVIESLYRIQQGNAELLSDPMEVAARCLVSAGLAPATYTAAQLKGWLETQSTTPPFDPKDPKAQSCFSNAGIAVGIG